MSPRTTPPATAARLTRLPTRLSSSCRLMAAMGLAASLSACSSFRYNSPETLFGLVEPYKIDVVQGNVVTQEVMAQIQPGLGRMQLKEILGTPLLADVFHADRWDYVFTIRRQGVADQQRRVTVFFKQDAVERFDTQPLPSEREFVAAIDKPLSDDLKAPQNLTEAQIAALPAPVKAPEVRKTPQGAVRAYPPLEPGQLPAVTAPALSPAIAPQPTRP